MLVARVRWCWGQRRAAPHAQTRARHTRGTRTRLQELEDGPWHQSNLEAGSSKIIPVPAPLGGAIVVGESVLTYFNTQQPVRSTQIKANTAIQVR
jgi:hypothetical protein